MIPIGKKNYNNMCILTNLDWFEMKRWNGFNGDFICFIIHSRPILFYTLLANYFFKKAYKTEHRNIRNYLYLENE